MESKDINVELYYTVCVGTRNFEYSEQNILNIQSFIYRIDFLEILIVKYYLDGKMAFSRNDNERKLQRAFLKDFQSFQPSIDSNFRILVETKKLYTTASKQLFVYEEKWRKLKRGF